MRAKWGWAPVPDQRKASLRFSYQYRPLRAEPKYFETDLVNIDVSKIKELREINNQLFIQDLIKIQKENE